MDQMNHKVDENTRSMIRRALKRKRSNKSRHLIQLSERLRNERGRIEANEGSASGSTTNGASALLEPRNTNGNNSYDSILNIVGEVVRDQLVNLEHSIRHTDEAKRLGSRQSKCSFKLHPSTENSIENKSSNVGLSTNLEFEVENSFSTTDQNNHEIDYDESIKTLIEPGVSRNVSDQLQRQTKDLFTENLFLPDETGLTCSQKTFRSILKLQIEIWRTLLDLKENTEILEKVAMSRHFHIDDDVPSIEEKISPMITTDSEAHGIILNSSLKAMLSQVESDQEEGTFSNYISNEYENSSYSCYSKMTEIEHRLSDVEFRMASIHQILQSVRQQQYKEIKFRRASFIRKQSQFKTSQSEKELDTEQIGDSKEVENIISKIMNAIEHQSDEPTTNVKVLDAMSIKPLNPYDESYYEWRQYHRNLLHYKKSERTIAFNKRAILNVKKPPILKYFCDVENQFCIRVRKPHFIITPSRTNLV